MLSYPRVMLLHMTKVYVHDSSNLLTRNLFGDWPRANLAQVYTGRYSGQGEFCGQYYEIGPRERRFGRLFQLLKPMGVGAMSGQSTAGVELSPRRLVVRRLAKRMVSAWIDSGIWEMTFRMCSSDALFRFTGDFKPDVLYTQGYSLGIVALSLEIAAYFRIPICYFPMDDWHSNLYAGSPLHREVNRAAIAIAERASIRFALGPKMTEELSRRYGVSFDCLYHADDLTRFEKVRPHQRVVNQPIVFGYTGSLYLGRASSLLDLLTACNSLGRAFEIRIYCPAVPIDTPSALLNSPNVKFLPLPAHDDLPQILANCDVLFLPESFNATYRRAIELSLSTKSHLYMLSGTPILAYGPPWNGTIDYAQRFGWGVVVDVRDNEQLLQGIRAATSEVLLPKVVAKQHEVARKNHDISTLRSYVLQRMTDQVGVL